MGVTQSMKSDGRQLGPCRNSLELLRKYSGVHQFAAVPGEHQAITVTAKAHHHTFMHLLELMRSERFDGERGQCDAPTALFGLWWLQSQPCLGNGAFV